MNFLAEHGEDEGGEAADKGTILHEIAEQCARLGHDPYSYVGERWSFKSVRNFEITVEHADAIANGLDYIESFEGELHVEYRVDIGKWMPGQFGTLDIGIVGKKLIVIFDWKFGGSKVDAVRNEQLMIYALAFWENVARHISDAEKFLLVIEQPFGGGGDEWEVTLEELLDFGRELKEKAAATYAKDAPRIPGPKQCHWCAGAKTVSCQEYNTYNLNLLFEDFADMDENMELGVSPRLPSVAKMTPERKSYIVQHKAMINKYLDRLSADLLSDALRGDPTPGMKAVYGRNPARKWKAGKEEDVKAALERLLGEDAYNRKLLSPSQAESELPAALYAKLKEFVDDGEPKPTLALEDSSKPRVPVLADMFDDIDD